MAENPLLPHRRLQELHALMLRCRDLERQYRVAPGLAREALLAATAIQAAQGDVLFGEPGDTTVDQLVINSSPAKRDDANPGARIPAGSQLLFGAGIARGLQAAGRGVCFALMNAGSDDGRWAEAVTYAQNARLPLIVIFADAGYSATSLKATTLPAFSKVCKRLRLPLLTVDGEDAIAVYRVVQESALRARHGDGPAIVWCAMHRRRTTGNSVSVPLAHIERYLSARGLKPLKR